MYGALCRQIVSADWSVERRYAGSDISVRIRRKRERRNAAESACAGARVVASSSHELLEDWNLAQAGASLKKIEPLD
jgi:hypothetical protein